MSDEELASLDLENKTFGVIGVCGVVGNKNPYGQGICCCRNRYLI